MRYSNTEGAETPAATFDSLPSDYEELIEQLLEKAKE
jgi:hypothetical protein